MHENNGYDSRLLLREYRARICKSFEESRNRFPAWRPGTTTLFDVPGRQAIQGLVESIPGLLKRLQIRAQRWQMYSAQKYAALINLQS
jgi:hypothetical protein